MVINLLVFGSKRKSTRADFVLKYVKRLLEILKIWSLGPGQTLFFAISIIVCFRLGFVLIFVGLVIVFLSVYYSISNKALILVSNFFVWRSDLNFLPMIFAGSLFLIEILRLLMVMFLGNVRFCLIFYVSVLNLSFLFPAVVFLVLVDLL